MNNTTPDAPRPNCHELDGQEWLFFDAVVPNVAIIRATTADEYGNLTFEDGAPRWAPWTWPTPRTTTAASSSPRSSAWPKAAACTAAVRVPGILVDAIVLAAGPAADHPDPLRPGDPGSCAGR